ncbi:hypothetical protein [Legionella gresilensis]|uniref:hypothetical protein n=1 Tax=Legionella gresilensis TaxID=91823 RepID=UPI00104112A3|nr:hypothetical protein [Legionella gresilensis]
MLKLYIEKNRYQNDSVTRHLVTYAEQYKEGIKEVVSNLAEAEKTFLKRDSSIKENLAAHLKQAVFAALEKIGNESKSSAEDIPGISSFCVGLKDKISFKQVNEVKDIFQQEFLACKDYYRRQGLLSSDNPKIKQKLKLIEEVIEANNSNIRLLFGVSKPEATQSKPSILETLDSYLTKRSNVKSNGITKQYYGSFFTCFKKSFDQKDKAVKALKKALNREPTSELLDHLPTLRDGELGKSLRAFIKAGYADNIVG